MESTGTGDSATAARQARFGSLPERIRFEDMVEEQQPASRTPDGYSPESSLIPYSCLALDLGL